MYMRYDDEYNEYAKVSGWGFWILHLPERYGPVIMLPLHVYMHKPTGG